jgi:plasmid maintenance system antidote protein VapI
MKKYSKGELLKILREQATPQAGQTQASVARRLGFSPQFINDVLAGKRDLSDSLASALGFHRAPTVYTRKLNDEE